MLTPTFATPSEKQARHDVIEDGGKGRKEGKDDNLAEDW